MIAQVSILGLLCAMCLVLLSVSVTFLVSIGITFGTRSIERTAHPEGLRQRIRSAGFLGDSLALSLFNCVDFNCVVFFDGLD